MIDYKKFYSEFLKGKEAEIHLTAHSHHFWPDITKEASLNSWELSKVKADKKWDTFFSKIIPQTRSLIASILNLTKPDQIAFAPNTHELLFRLLSCFFEQDKINILTTDSEFHSFDRQIERLREWEKFKVVKLTQNEDQFEENLIKEASANYDLIFISHVFFNSGKVLSEETLQKLIKNKSPKTLLVLDGYHSFCALDFDMSPYEEDVFFLAGSYKYAQAGEGMCFMTIPSKQQLRPLNTGWFAHFDSLENKPSVIKYSNGGDGFWGATQDMTPFFRFNAVWSFFKANNITISLIHEKVLSLQTYFIKNNPIKKATLLNMENPRAHFLSYQFDSLKAATEFESFLTNSKIFIDRRNDVIRLGFAPYHDKEQVDEIISKIRSYC